MVTVQYQTRLLQVCIRRGIPLCHRVPSTVQSSNSTHPSAPEEAHHMQKAGKMLYVRFLLFSHVLMEIQTNKWDGWDLTQYHVLVTTRIITIQTFR